MQRLYPGVHAIDKQTYSLLMNAWTTQNALCALYSIAMAMGWLSMGYIRDICTIIRRVQGYTTGSRIYARKVNWLPNHHRQLGIKQL